MINFIKKYIPLDLALVSLTWVVVIMMLGLIDFVDFSFDPSRFFTPKYVADVLTMLVAGILIFTVTLYMKYKKLKDDSEDTKKIEKSINKTFQEEDSSNLAAYVNAVNIERRVEQYKLDTRLKYENLLSEIAEKTP